MAIEDIERLKEKLDKDPNSKLFVPLAEEYKKTGMLDEAIDVLTKGLERQPSYLSARVSLGKIYMERGMLDAAGDEFEKVIAVIPDNLYAHKKLAEIYKAVAKRDEAIKEFKTVLRLNPADEWAASNLSSIDQEATVSPQGPSAKTEEPVPLKRETEITPLQAESAEMRHEVPDETLTGRDVEISAIISQEEEKEEPAAEEKPAEITAGAEEMEFWKVPSEPEEIEEVKEKAPEAAISGEETEPWSILSEETKDIEEEREVPPQKAISKEDMDLWRAHLESVEETDITPQEGKEVEPFAEVGELFEEEPVEVTEILKEQEPSVQEIFSKEEVQLSEPVSGQSGQSVADADKWIINGKYGEAMKVYRTILSADPGNRHALQRIEELRSLLRLLGKDKEELVMKLERFLKSVKQRRDELSGTA